MKCTDLAQRIEQLRPSARVQDVARLCLLISNSSSIEELEDDGALMDAWKKVDLRMRAAADQHAAVTLDLEKLQAANLPAIEPQVIWKLIRTFRVQSQLLRLYVERPEE